MAARFLRRLMGGSSSGSSRREQEDEEADTTPSEVGDVSPPTQQDEVTRVRLSQDPAKGYWWDDKLIKSYVTWSFTRTYGEYFTKWSEASQEQWHKMYTYFTTHVKNVNAGYNPRPKWERRVRRRITALINGAKRAKNKPEWIPVEWWERMKTRETTNPDFAKLSATNKLNRRSGKKDGPALGTHTLGRKSAIDAFKELGKDPTPYKLMEKSKKKKKGEWICPRAAQTDKSRLQEKDKSADSRRSATGRVPSVL